jgi:hypothetical protein
VLLLLLVAPLVLVVVSPPLLVLVLASEELEESPLLAEPSPAPSSPLHAASPARAKIEQRGSESTELRVIARGCHNRAAPGRAKYPIVLGGKTAHGGN